MTGPVRAAPAPTVKERAIALVSTGMSLPEAAEQLLTTDRTLHRWMRDDPAFAAALRAARAVHYPPPTRVSHGTPSMYRHHDCRCEPCREANTESARAQREARIATGPPPGHPHNASTYKNYGCRCDVCTADHSARMRAIRRKQRGAA